MESDKTMSGIYPGEGIEKQQFFRFLL